MNNQSELINYIVNDYSSLNHKFIQENNFYCIPQKADFFHTDEEFLSGVKRVLQSRPKESMVVYPFLGDDLSALVETIEIDISNEEKIDDIFGELFGHALLLVNTSEDLIILTTYNDYRLVVGSLDVLRIYFNNFNEALDDYDNFILKSRSFAEELDDNYSKYLNQLMIGREQYYAPQ